MKTRPIAAPDTRPIKLDSLDLPPDSPLPTILYGEMTALEFVTLFGTRSFHGRMYGIGRLPELLTLAVSE